MSPARLAAPHGPLVRVAGFRLHVLDTERTTRRAQWTPKQQPIVPVSSDLLQVGVRRRDCRTVRDYQHTEMRDHKILRKRKAVQATMGAATMRQFGRPVDGGGYDDSWRRSRKSGEPRKDRPRSESCRYRRNLRNHRSPYSPPSSWRRIYSKPRGRRPF